jgi:hypothetical protein
VAVIKTAGENVEEEVVEEDLGEGVAEVKLRVVAKARIATSLAKVQTATSGGKTRIRRVVSRSGLRAKRVLRLSAATRAVARVQLRWLLPLVCFWDLVLVYVGLLIPQACSVYAFGLAT